MSPAPGKATAAAAKRRRRAETAALKPAPNARASAKPAPPKLAPSLPPFEFLESRVQIPPLKTGTISRTPLVNRLRAATSTAVATGAAPAGAGKTPLLSGWAGKAPRQFAWITVDERDNDPVVLARHIAAALAQTGELSPHLVNALSSPGKPIWGG